MSDDQERVNQVIEKNSKMLYILAGFACFMLGFGVFVLPWFYDMACSFAGINLNPNNDVKMDGPRAEGDTIKVSFQARVLDNLPVRFYAKEQRSEIRPGETGTNTFYFENLSNEMVYLRPIHFVSPDFAAAKFKMMVCFCFNDQALAPGEEKEYEIQYGFGDDLDIRVRRAMVRYDLHKIDKERMKPYQDGPTGVDPEKVAEIIEEAKQ